MSQYLRTVRVPLLHQNALRLVLFQQALPAVNPIRLAHDRIGHDPDGHQRLLNPVELDHRKADCREHPQSAHKSHPRRQIL